MEARLLLHYGRRAKSLISSFSRRRTQFSLTPSYCLTSILASKTSANPISKFQCNLNRRFFGSRAWQGIEPIIGNEEYPLEAGNTSDEEVSDGWEEEDEVESKFGDGGDGGGIVIKNVSWGKRTLALAHEVLLQFGDDMKLFAFKTTPRGYIYIRLDKMSNMYGCPSMEEIEKYCSLFNKRLEELGETREIPDNLALEVSSPGAERILKVPDDLDRFKDMPMTVLYVENESDHKIQLKDGVFLLDSIQTESEQCVWKLADVKENRDPSTKGKPLNRKQRDLRLKLPYQFLKKVTLYLE